MHLKSRILRQMRGTDAQEYLCVFQAAVTMQMPEIRLSQAYVFLCGGSFCAVLFCLISENDFHCEICIKITCKIWLAKKAHVL